MAITKEDLDNRFKHHAPAEGSDKPSRYAAIRNSMRTSAQTVVEVTPASREQSLAITKLEEAMFWANAAIARTHPDE